MGKKKFTIECKPVYKHNEYSNEWMVLYEFKTEKERNERYDYLIDLNCFGENIWEFRRVDR